MEALALSLLFKIGPYVAAILGVVAVYFGIKRKGAVDERAKWEQAVEREKEKVAEAIEGAVHQDRGIDEKVRGQIDAIKKREEAGDRGVDDPSIFRF